jgi:hypothetical protein
MEYAALGLSEKGLVKVKLSLYRPGHGFRASGG